jgi:ABC-2 type transport system ATP-binding protein
MLILSHLTKTYPGGKTALKDLSLTVQAGDIFGFIGHNGAGKTTAIKCIMGILPYEAGEVLVDGINMKTDPVAAKRVMAYIPDNPDLYEHLTGLQYLTFIADVFNVPQQARLERISATAQALELTSALGDPIASYSHGMKQKLALIAAFVHEPKVLVLDEPFVGLDPKASHTLKGMMKQMTDKGGVIFFSTHVLEVAEKLCNKVAIIKDGRLVASGATGEVTGNQSLEDVFMELIDHEQ